MPRPLQPVSRSGAYPLLGAGLLLALATPALASELLPLREGWALQSSAKVAAGGERLSQPGFVAQGFTPATVPNTVLGALVSAGVHPDPYFGMNLRSLPGMTYPIAKNFVDIEMSADSPFRPSWWYRTEFELPPSFAGKSVWLRLDGINYRGRVWLNGERVATPDELVGAFRRYELDVSRLVKAGAKNALAVEVSAPGPQDLAISWVDWSPAPPDKNMGLIGAVALAASGPVTLRHPYVTTRFDHPALAPAHLTVAAELRNTTDRPATATVRGAIESGTFTQDVALGPNETRTVRFAPEAFPGLNLKKPRVWWPYQMGPAELYELRLEALVDGAVSDVQTLRFGVREVGSELTDKGHRLFKVNGRKVLVRGGGWAPDMLLRRSPERLEAELRYVREIGLNTIRLEGKLEDDELLDRADREGILVMAGWCCCDHWEQWPKWSRENREVAALSLRDQALHLRSHPSVLVWLNGSDGPPPPDIEKRYLDVLRDAGWPLPILSSATAVKSKVSGPSGVKMTGPYDYVPPSYWLLDKQRGGAQGFNTETSPGPAVPPIESLKRMLPADHLWPIDDHWNFHAGGNEFANVALFTAALEGRYGPARNAEDYARKAQALAYEGQRAMFEAYARNKYTSTGVIQWMLNNAWPSLIWHLYDYYLRPGGGYFGTKKACEPVHVQYSYDDGSIAVVSGRPEPLAGLKVAARVYDVGLVERFSKEATVDVPADGVVRALSLPPLKDLSTTYFLRLDLQDATGQPLSSNLYWLSTKPDVLNWAKSEWFTTPVSAHADVTGVGQLAPTSLKLAADFADRDAEGTARVRLENAGSSLAFQVRLKLTDGAGGEEILPVFWDDNYVSLLPGETRELRASYRLRDRKGRPALEAEAWNAPKISWPPADAPGS
jgi:exo-1,4-beta-D-glucosaminidase